MSEIKCVSCKNTKNSNFFLNSKGGYNKCCYECVEKVKERNKLKKDQIKIYKKEYFKKNKEHLTILHKEYRKKNQEELRDFHEKYYELNKEHLREYAKKYRETKKKYLITLIHS